MRLLPRGVPMVARWRRRVDFSGVVSRRSDGSLYIAPLDIERREHNTIAPSSSPMALRLFLRIDGQRTASQRRSAEPQGPHDPRHVTWCDIRNRPTLHR